MAKMELTLNLPPLCPQCYGATRFVSDIDGYECYNYPMQHGPHTKFGVVSVFDAVYYLKKELEGARAKLARLEDAQAAGNCCEICND